MIRVNIDKILSQKNKTVYWLGKEANITQYNLGKLVKNQTNSIKFDSLEKICDVLECDISDILEITKDTEINKKAEEK
ncbi:helix-turn-helix domain-containing protein [Clostridium scatologenes]|uniref:Cro/CI family transcriptional regulator-like protein n=1 Tax=Clostridium scatologenes TaxID=1548 RepID=A0A0E3M6Z4_CLOSL|nr:helix-turn-helix transcriptional regulator [Clostridium scatologenes]AKA70175.1 Cro/CI family transcriptional regulator -like protein [Clostridium scatologenes]